MKTKTWILILCALLLACIALSLWLLLPRGDAAFAEVRSDGKLIMTLDLSEDRTVTVESAYGTNVITVRDGRVAVTEADCPDRICVNRGFCAGGAAIVCLPHRLVITFVGELPVDAAAG